MYNPTNHDIELVLQGIKKVKIEIDIINNDGTIQGAITGITLGGNHIIDSSSSVRRTFSISLSPDADKIIDVENFSKLIDCTYKLYTLVWDNRNKTYTKYPNGEYMIQSMNFNYDAKNNILQLQASDLMTKYNGTISGDLPAYITKISPYKVDELGNPVEDSNGNLTYFVIKDELIGYLKYAGIKKYMITDDIGEYRGIAHYNKDYATYRQNHPQWNCIPYEIDLSPTDSYETVFNKLCTFYSNYDYAFDEDGVFVLKMIPSTYSDDIVMDNTMVQKILVADNSENVTIDVTAIKNISIVWGDCFSPDYYAETSSYSAKTYSVLLDNIQAYENDNMYAVMINTPNETGSQLEINVLGRKVIYDEETDEPVKSGKITKGVWCFKYKNGRMYLMGQYQIHAVNILSNGTNKNYNLDYFKEKYNCDTVSITVIPDSPFAIEKIGLREKSYNDESCKNLGSNSLALSYAEYLTWKTARITDEISLSCTLIPWLREYTKFSYRPKNVNEERQYIIKTINHDYASGITNITAYRFYPLYEN